MMDYHSDLTGDEKIVQQAKECFKRAEEWEAEARTNFIFDSKFCNGDSANLWQWDDDISNDRISLNRPCLTVNKTKQHCLQVINDQRQNQSQVEVRPVGNGASYEAAKVFEGVVRHIEYQSNAQAAYSNACYNQVIGGLGYWRIITDYAHDDSFDQEIYIRRVADTLSVYLDPDIQEADGSDARWGIVFKDMPREDFESEYPAFKDLAGTQAPLGESSANYDHFNTKDHIRVCEYFVRSSKTDKLHELDNGDTIRESDVKQANLLDQLKINSVRSRDIETPNVTWYLIAGSEIIDRKDWLGKYIPLVRCIGEEIVIDKRLDRRGLTRALIDPQKIYNYYTSSAVESVALQTKTPYITSVEAITGFETEWGNANLENKAYLAYNGISENGQEIKRPEREPPPMMSQAYLEGMKTALGEMMLVTGMYEANLGQKSNEVSGTAVDARQRQGQNATFQYIDRFSQAIRFTGRILVDLIPKVYDVARVLKIIAINGDQSSVQLDPNAPQAHQSLQSPDDDNFDPQAIQSIFNPNVGIYDVECDIGPAWATRRQETFNAISQILKVNESLSPIIGDLLFRAADFPMADEIAERLRNMVPKQAFGQQPPDPQIGQLQQMLAQQHSVLQKQEQELTESKLRETAAKTQKMIEEYRAETDRMKAIGTIDPAAMMPIIRQLVSEALGTNINPIIAQHALENSQMAQMPSPPSGAAYR